MPLVSGKVTISPIRHSLGWSALNADHPPSTQPSVTDDVLDG
jgi:hypothetical protein